MDNFIKNIYGGGTTTTANGKNWEKATSLYKKLVNAGFTLMNYKGTVYAEILDKNGRPVGLYGRGFGFYRCLEKLGALNYRKKVSSLLRPDEAIFVYATKQLYIFEKKIQVRSGSVDEKLQTGGFKKAEFQKMVKEIGYTAKYIYILNDWFRAPKYKDVFSYLNKCHCEHCFGEYPIERLNLSKKKVKPVAVAEAY